MALIKDWLPDFLIRYRSRLRPADWPEPGSEDEAEFQGAWFMAFMALDPKVREGEADTASFRLASNPPNFAREHLPAILAEVRALRANNAVQSTAIPESKQAAEHAARNCVHCAGSGLVTVFAPDYDGSPVVEREEQKYGEVIRVTRAARASAHCVCPLGRWMRSKLDGEMRGQVPDLQDVFDGRTRWTDRDPTAPPENLDADPVAPTEALANLKAMIRGATQRRRVPVILGEDARRERQKQREAILARRVLELLAGGPLPWRAVVDAIAPEGWTDGELRRAADRAGVEIVHDRGREVWSPPRPAAAATDEVSV